MKEEIIRSKTDINDKLSNFTVFGIVLMVVVFAFLFNVFVGLLFLFGAYFLYTKFVYKVFLTSEFIVLKYLHAERKIPICEISYLQIVKAQPHLTLGLSIKIKEAKKRVNFSYGDQENLLKIINYFQLRHMEIIDKNNLLFTSYNIRLNTENQSN